MVKVCYDPEGDLLEVQFAPTVAIRQGIGLTGQITLFFDQDLTTPVGLTATSYIRLLSLPQLLTELAEAPDDIQQRVRQSLQRPPLKHFLHLEADAVCLADVRLSEMATASPIP